MVLESFLSRTNSVLRWCASLLPQRDPVRLVVSKGWTRALSILGAGIAIPLGDRTMKVLPRFRSLSPGYEAETLAVWLKLLRPGDAVWDIGANIGVYTVLSGKVVGPEGAIDCWEPAPDSYRATCEHIEMNGLAVWCKGHQSAVSSADGGTMPFSIVGGRGTDPTNRLGSAQGAIIDVPIESLDGILSRSDRRPSYVKIDIEGAEIFALRGAETLMTEPLRPVVLLAVHPMFLPEFDCEPEEIAKLVSQRGYLSFDMSGRPCSPVEYAEYLLVPQERRDEVCDAAGWSKLTR